MPNVIARARRWFRALLRGGELDREVDAEMRLHLELEENELMRTRGLARDEARRQAMIAFGGTARHREAHRDARRVRPLEELGQDVRYAIRSLGRSPGFTVAAVLVLALGIGGTAAVFSAVRAVLLAPLPYPHDDRLVRIFQRNSATNRWSLSVVDYQAIATQSRSLQTVGVMRIGTAAVAAGSAEPDRIRFGQVSASLFPTLGVRVAAGRAIAPADEAPGAPAALVVTDGFAVRAFGGVAAALGHHVTVDGAPETIIGVLPRGTTALAGVQADAWSALQLAPPTRRGPFGLAVIGRLAPGATLADAARDLSGISTRIFPLWAAGFHDSTARLTPYPLRDVVVGSAGHTLGIFGAAVALVLLIAIANVASLMLVRATTRWREMQVRTALGATRARLVRLVITESVILALAGGAAGVGIGALALHLFGAIGPHVPRLDEARLDLAAVGVAGGIAVLSGVIVGLAPVLLMLRRQSAAALGAGVRQAGAGQRTQTVRGAFVTAQFALALPLLASAGLLLNSFVHLQRVRPGFDPSHILAVPVSLPVATYPDSLALVGYWRRALAVVSAIPGVTAAGIASGTPPDDPTISTDNFDLVDQPSGNAPQPTAPWVLADADYFSALGVPLLDGRLFTSADDLSSAPPVMLVSRAWARRYFPGANAVGRRLIQGGCTSCGFTTIVGVVGDVKYSGLGASGEAMYTPVVGQMYAPPASLGPARDLTLFVRTTGDPVNAIRPVQAALRSIDPDIPLRDAAPMADRVASSITEPKHWTFLLGGFAAAALLLASVGIFGMLSYAVALRRREIGVRMALGAQRRNVVGMVVRRGLAYALTGAAVGLVATLAATRWLGGLLFGVGATDPATIAGVSAVLIAVAALASWLPARRAARIDPVEMIRAE